MYGRHHLDELLPSLGNLQLQLLQNVLPIEHHVEGLGLRQRVQTVLQPVLGVRAGRVGLQHLLIIRKLRQILRRISQRIVHGLVRSHGKHHIGALARHHGVQQGIGADDLHIHLHAGLGSKGVVHHGLQDGSLIPSRHHPYLHHFVLVVVHVTHRVIIDHIGCRKGLDLMPYLGKYSRLVLFRFGISAGDYQIVYIQLGYAQVQSGSAQSRDIVLEGYKLYGNFVRALRKSFQLLGQRLGGGDMLRLLSRQIHHVVHDLVETLGLQRHGLDDLRVHVLNIVVSIFVRRRARIDQYSPIHLVQPIGGILQTLQNGSQPAKRHLQPQGMVSLRQVEPVRISLLIGKGHAVPVIVILKGDLFHLLERNLTVYVQTSAGDAASGIILAALYGKIIKTVLRNLHIPFNPLPRAAPRISPHIVQKSLGNTVGLGVGRRPIIFRIQRGFRAKHRVLPLHHSHIAAASLRGLGSCTSGQISLVRQLLLHGGHSQPAQHHGLVHSLQRDGIGSFFQIEFIGLHDISHGVPEVARLPAVSLHLLGTDLVAPIVLLDGASVRPQSGECHVGRPLEGQLPVHIKRSLNGHASGLNRPIFQIYIVKPCLRHLHLPGNNRAFSRVQSVLYSLKTVVDFHVLP